MHSDQIIIANFLNQRVELLKQNKIKIEHELSYVRNMIDQLNQQTIISHQPQEDTTTVIEHDETPVKPVSAHQPHTPAPVVKTITGAGVVTVEEVLDGSIRLPNKYILHNNEICHRVSKQKLSMDELYDLRDIKKQGRSTRSDKGVKKLGKASLAFIKKPQNNAGRDFPY